jgi:gluconolactonase
MNFPKRRNLLCSSACAGLLVVFQISVSAQSINLPETIVSKSSKIEIVKNGLNYSEGPVIDATGTLYFSEMATSSTKAKVWKVPKGGTASVFREGAYFNGIECDKSGNLIFCERNLITRYSEGKYDTLAKDSKIRDANDITVASNGAMYFSNHRENDYHLFYRSPEGTLKSWNQYGDPNGVEWLEEKQLLYICNTAGNVVTRYTVNNDGTISNAKKFADVANPDGLTVDKNYNVYIASWKEGIFHVFDSSGTKLGTIAINSTSKSGDASNCVFGIGDDNKTLYLTGNGGAFKLKMNTEGRPRFTSAVRNQNILKFDLVNNSKSKLITFGASVKLLPSQTVFDLKGRNIPGMQEAGKLSRPVSRNIYVIR